MWDILEGVYVFVFLMRELVCNSNKWGVDVYVLKKVIEDY